MSEERTERTERSERPQQRSSGPRKRRPFQRRKVCRFCADKNITIDYKDPRVLRSFITERGKIIPRRISGNCSKHQREITEAIKRARNIALIPIASAHVMA
ncbi:30S ribosomal protein S18 [Geobacter sp.]|uniref:30S ribosomal protein S18 n=1 Tax=Geobacter sp. TaxID=46610 RepID=UPI00260CCD0B|nr:30S ribosomal protein S18 [Geobacter sp.]